MAYASCSVAVARAHTIWVGLIRDTERSQQILVVPFDAAAYSSGWVARASARAIVGASLLVSCTARSCFPSRIHERGSASWLAGWLASGMTGWFATWLAT